MKKEQQIYVLAGLCAVLLIFVYIRFMLGPVNQSISEKLKEIEKTTNTLKSAKAEADALEELREKSEELQEEVASLQKLLPQTQELPNFLRIVTKVAQRFGIRIISFQPQQAISKPNLGYTEVPYMLTVAGNFHNLGNFLAEIGQEERLISVKNLIINASPNQEKGETISTTMILVAYTAGEIKGRK